MVLPIQHRHLIKVERAHPLQTGDIHAELVRIGAALVVGVNSATRAKEVLGCSCIEPIACQYIRAAHDVQAIQLADTAMAPRIWQNEQVHRALSRPLLSSTSNPTALQ